MAAGFQKDASGRSSFQRFLNWLDAGVDSAGEKYLEIRRRLVHYFDRKNCLSPDELADETLNRVARRLEEEGTITATSPAQYCYVVARFVFLEYQRRPEHRQISLDGVSDFGDVASRMARPPATDDEVENQEKRIHCLERCLQTLKADDRELICEYYRGEQRTKIKHRRELALRLGLTMNALSIRACRIRARLEECVRTCLAEP
jgi:DNA-directed RNA polymerase specialized sigma24 family protein